MNRRAFFGLPFLGFLPKKVFKEEKKDRKKFVYRYYFVDDEKRLSRHAIYLEGGEWISMSGQHKNGRIWKMRYKKDALFLFEMDWKKGLCTKDVYGEKEWVYNCYDCKTQIG